MEKLPLSAVVDDRYDIWECARCRSQKHKRAVPHDPPTCCGTGMWYQSGYKGIPYIIREES